MSLRILPKVALPEWLEWLGANYRLIGPKAKQGAYVFDEIQAVEELCLDYSITILPPKKVLLPQQETLLQFDTSGSVHRVEPVFDDTPTVIFGVHTCDMHAIALMDRVFDQGYTDRHYRTRRKHSTIVTIECLNPCSEFSFCKSMGTLSVPEEFDLHIIDLGNAFSIEVGSPQGIMLLQHLTAVREAKPEDFQQLHRVMSEKWPRFSYRLDFDVSELSSLIALSYRSELWTSLGEQCLGCGTCNIVCPTCNCFDVIDQVDFGLQSGSRCRVWDSCQLDRFSSLAGGHDFRTSRASRLRHRFFHKFKYQPELYEVVGCVGCGRCAQECLVHISPVDVLNELYRRQVPYASIAQEVLV